MLMTEKTTTNTITETRTDNERFEDIQKIFSKRNNLRKAENPTRRVEAHIQTREKKKLKKKRRIASILSWIITFISGVAVFTLIIKWLDKVIAVGDPRFFGWCFLAYIPIATVFILVGEYIESQIWDKDFE